MEIYNADTIERYNQYFGFEIRHPLVAVVRFDPSMPPTRHKMQFGFYALFLKNTKGCVIDYGKTRYDFDAETVVSMAPGQTVGISPDPEARPVDAIGLLFHPDFLHRTSLAGKMSRYTFFSYASREALHLSSEERDIINDYMQKIARELHHGIDKFTKPLIISNIEILLNYCLRFYERQFITREDLNLDALAIFEAQLDTYLHSDAPFTDGTPTVKYFADKACLSPNYFGDMIKAQTAKTALEYIRLKMLTVAKERLHNPQMNVKQVAASIGFQHSQHFVRFFKQLEGITPTEYKNRIAV